MRRSLRPLVFPTALAGAALVWSAIAQADQVGIQVVSQDVSVDTSNMTATFKVTFDQPPQFVANDSGQPQAFQYEIDADNGVAAPSMDWSDIDTVIRGGEIWEGQGVPVRDSQGDGGMNSGGWGPVRAFLPFDLNGDTVTFTAGLSALGDTDGKFRYRLIASDNGEMTGQAAGAVIPMPPALWTGIFMLGAIVAVGKLRILKPI